MSSPGATHHSSLARRTSFASSPATGTELQQPHLGRDIPVTGIQLANLIPHGFPPALDADPADSPPHGGAEAPWSPRQAGADCRPRAAALSRLAARYPRPQPADDGTREDNGERLCSQRGRT